MAAYSPLPFTQFHFAAREGFPPPLACETEVRIMKGRRSMESCKMPHVLLSALVRTVFDSGPLLPPTLPRPVPEAFDTMLRARGVSRLDEALFDAMSSDDEQPVQGFRTLAGAIQGEEDGEDGEKEKEGEEEETQDKENVKPDEEVKPKKYRPKFTEDHLVGEKGFERIYRTFPAICKFRGAGYEAEDLARLLRCYKEWAFQLFPQLAFEDLLERIQKLSGKARVRRHLDELREQERERYLAAKFGADYQDKLEEHRKQQAREEARREEQRVRMREEIYGIRPRQVVRDAESGEEDSTELVLEDLGEAKTAAQIEQEKQQHAARLARIHNEQRQRRKNKGLVSSSTASISSDESEEAVATGGIDVGSKLPGDESGEASRRLREYLRTVVECSEHLEIEAESIVEKSREECDLGNFEAEDVRQVGMTMLQGWLDRKTQADQKVQKKAEKEKRKQDREQRHKVKVRERQRVSKVTGTETTKRKPLRKRRRLRKGSESDSSNESMDIDLSTAKSRPISSPRRPAVPPMATKITSNPYKDLFGSDSDSESREALSLYAQPPPTANDEENMQLNHCNNGHAQYRSDTAAGDAAAHKQIGTQEEERLQSSSDGVPEINLAPAHTNPASATDIRHTHSHTSAGQQAGQSQLQEMTADTRHRPSEVSGPPLTSSPSSLHAPPAQSQTVAPPSAHLTNEAMHSAGQIRNFQASMKALDADFSHSPVRAGRNSLEVIESPVSQRSDSEDEMAGSSGNGMELRGQVEEGRPSLDSDEMMGLLELSEGEEEEEEEEQEKEKERESGRGTESEREESKGGREAKGAAQEDFKLVVSAT